MMVKGGGLARYNLYMLYKKKIGFNGINLVPINFLFKDKGKLILTRKTGQGTVPINLYYFLQIVFL